MKGNKNVSDGEPTSALDNIVRPDAGEIRRRRMGGDGSLDVWDPDSFFEMSQGRAQDLVQALRIGDPEESEPGGRIGSYLVRRPEYVPYESPRIPRSAAGDALCRQFMETVFSPDVTAAVMASPMADL
jgi:hypothetical protein